MRIRSIRPEFWTSEDIARLDWHTRLIYIGLWSYVDDNGVGKDDETLIMASLFPHDMTAERIPEPSLDSSGNTHGGLTEGSVSTHGGLSECSRRVHGGLNALFSGGQIVRYCTGGVKYLHIVAWSKHQIINRKSASRFPLPTRDDIEHSLSTHGGLSEYSVSTHSICPLGEGEKGRRGEGEKTTWSLNLSKCARENDSKNKQDDEVQKAIASLSEKHQLMRQHNLDRWHTEEKIPLDQLHPVTYLPYQLPDDDGPWNPADFDNPSCYDNDGW